MFIILLKFADNKARAGQFMDGHKDWIAKGFEDGVFLTVGSIQPNAGQPNAGGAIIAHGATLPEIEARVNKDPFVVENIVTAEVIEITPARTDERLDFLKDEPKAA